MGGGVCADSGVDATRRPCRTHRRRLKCTDGPIAAPPVRRHPRPSRRRVLAHAHRGGSESALRHRRRVRTQRPQARHRTAGPPPAGLRDRRPTPPGRPLRPGRRRPRRHGGGAGARAGRQGRCAPGRLRRHLRPRRLRGARPRHRGTQGAAGECGRFADHRRRRPLSRIPRRWPAAGHHRHFLCRRPGGAGAVRARCR